MLDDSFQKSMPDRLNALPDIRARVKKAIIVFAALFASLAAARADLVMEQQSSDTNSVHHVTLKLHADKMRMDEQTEKGPAFSVIIELDTRDSITLIPQGKLFLKRSGAEIQKQMEAEAQATHGTNAMDNPPATAVDAGKAANVDGYDTEIYTWSGPNGMTETMWVATNYPHYEAIRTELAKLDRFDASGPHKGAQPELSLLPGMVVKAEKALGGHKVTVTLVSASAKPVDASLFELPADYTPWKPPVLQTTNTATTNQ
jgi:hypothetical protein